jgi:hypothetical protein
VRIEAGIKIYGINAEFLTDPREFRLGFRHSIVNACSIRRIS